LFNELKRRNVILLLLAIGLTGLGDTLVKLERR
jgi:hypothetical protein